MTIFNNYYDYLVLIVQLIYDNRQSVIYYGIE